MAYLKIDNTDFSMYVSGLKVGRKSNYNAQTNAAGNTVVDFINSKRTVAVNIIPLDDAAMKSLLAAINKFNVSLSFRDPTTGNLEEINAIIPDSDIDYYTIRADKTSYKALSLTFTEL
jgi:hypothetical protein